MGWNVIILWENLLLLSLRTWTWVIIMNWAQVIREVLKNPADKAAISLVFANRTEKDILLKKEIDALAKKHSNFKVTYILSQPSDSWKGLKGAFCYPFVQLYQFIMGGFLFLHFWSNIDQRPKILYWVQIWTLRVPIHESADTLYFPAG